MDTTYHLPVFGRLDPGLQVLGRLAEVPSVQGGQGRMPSKGSNLLKQSGVDCRLGAV